MKTSATLLALLAAPALAVDVNPEYIAESCITLCSTLHETSLPHTVCSHVFNTRPKPVVWQSCKMGLETGFQDTCMPTCMMVGSAALVKAGKEGNSEFAELPKQDFMKACNPENAMHMPRNVFKKNCNMGYKGVFDAMVILTTTEAEKLFGFDDSAEFDKVKQTLAKEEEDKRQAALQAEYEADRAAQEAEVQRVIDEEARNEAIRVRRDAQGVEAAKAKAVKEKEDAAKVVADAAKAAAAAAKAAAAAADGGGLRGGAEEADEVPADA